MSEYLIEETIDTDCYMEHSLHEVFNPSCSVCYANHSDCKWCAMKTGVVGKAWYNTGDGGEGDYKPCDNQI